MLRYWKFLVECISHSKEIMLFRLCVDAMLTIKTNQSQSICICLFHLLMTNKHFLFNLIENYGAEVAGVCNRHYGPATTVASRTRGKTKERRRRSCGPRNGYLYSNRFMSHCSDFHSSIYTFRISQVFKEFVETFQDAPSSVSKVWVKAGTYDAGSRSMCHKFISNSTMRCELRLKFFF